MAASLTPSAAARAASAITHCPRKVRFPVALLCDSADNKAISRYSALRLLANLSICSLASSTWFYAIIRSPSGVPSERWRILVVASKALDTAAGYAACMDLLGLLELKAVADRWTPRPRASGEEYLIALRCLRRCSAILPVVSATAAYECASWLEASARRDVSSSTYECKREHASSAAPLAASTRVKSLWRSSMRRRDAMDAASAAAAVLRAFCSSRSSLFTSAYATPRATSEPCMCSTCN